MKNYVFLSTRPLKGPYKFIINSSVKNFEKKYKKKTEISFFKKKIILNLNYFFFLIRTLFISLFYKKNYSNIKYQNIDLSTHVLSQTFKDYRSYTSKVIFYINFVKNLYFALCILNTAKKLPKNIAAVYIDHGMYLNGILFQFFLKKKIIIYSNNLPRGLFKIKGSIKNKNKSYADFLRLHKTYRLNKNKIKKTYISLKKIIYKNEIIPWLKKTKYNKIKNLDYSKFTHVVYAHSFTDAQLIFGYDGFINSKDWLTFTLDNLLREKKNKVLLKAHPNFYNKSMGNQAIWDKKIFNMLKNEISQIKNLTILDVPIKNHELLNKLNKKTVLISHHSNALLEGIYFGFKCISSKKTFWKCSKFKLTNYWSNNFQYAKLLKKNWKDLKFAKKKDFYSLLYEYLISDYNIGGKKYFLTLIQKILNIRNINEVFKLINYSKFNNPNSNVFTKIICALANNIEEL